MIDSYQIQCALRPRFGSSLVETPGFADPAAALLRDYVPGRLSLSELSSRLEDVLFNALYDRLGPSMNVLLDNGSRRRIRLAELPEAADDALGVLFDSLQPLSATYDLVRGYAMETGSFSAMRSMYQHFSSFMTAEERRVLARVIRGSFPPDRWRDWLPLQDAGPSSPRPGA